MIAEAVVANWISASAEDIARISHAHPTYTEAIKEAALDATEFYLQKDRIESYSGELEKIEQLTDFQQKALREIEKHYESKDVVLLPSVTGSGNLILFTSFLLAQTSVQTYNPQVYTEQQIVGKEMTVEKSLLAPKNQLDNELSRIQSDPVLRYATWGFAVYDPHTEKMITCYKRECPLVSSTTIFG
ncbi:hypothetical protein FQR65_LT19110 [Abscondita terminalis]|nr:hypothetical protein FQR65_LT19110 [Abscondita terminalis]